ncbi:MAG: hypothetical protein ABI960_00960 [Candidatus Eisenbacteria bacterium]
MTNARPIVSTAGVLAGLALIAAIAHAGSWEAIERLPGRTATSVQVNGKPRVYFKITRETPLDVPIDGPSRLSVVSRAILPKGSSAVVRYTLVVSDRGRELERHDTESSPASKVRDPSAAAELGKSRRMTVDVPAGAHSVTLAVIGPTPVLVRLRRAASTSDGQPTVSLTPVVAERTMPVLENERTIPYYGLTIGHSVRYRVVGPTTLDLLTRLDFDRTMRGTQAYRIAISERGNRVREASYRTTKATAATYTNVRDRVPSKFDRLQLAVGAGLHEFDITLLAPAGHSASVHARIPQPTVGGEE